MYKKMLVFMKLQNFSFSLNNLNLPWKLYSQLFFGCFFGHFFNKIFNVFRASVNNQESVFFFAERKASTSDLKVFDS